MKRRLFMGLLMLGVLMSMATGARAATFNCHEQASGGYCKYVGKIQQLYINESNVMLMYYETPIDLIQASDVGLACASLGNAAIYKTTWPSAEYFYSTLLMALTADREINIQLGCAHDTGYLNIDRIWLR